MDDPAISPDAHDHALNGLARLNRLSLASTPFRDHLQASFAREDVRDAARPLEILDVATGSGDLVVDLETWRRSLPAPPPVRWIACDLSDHALARARDRAADIDLDLEVVRRDATRDDLPRCDLVFCSLFLHHLTESEVQIVLGRMVAAARLGGLVTDLKRTRLGWLLASLVPRICTRSEVVHADAVGSVRAAFSKTELADLVRRASVPNADVFDSFPERQGVRWTVAGRDSGLDS